MRIEAMGTAALGDGSFDASHPITGARCRVMAVNDDDPSNVKWLVAYTKDGCKVVETVDVVKPSKDPFGRARHWEW